ncbi:MAG TPA: universal stress protein [Chloroflexia bacterium]|nr:universal stress protein [Chloroflexia bacterium]
MTGHIIVPLDGLQQAEAVLPLALRTALKTRASLTLLRVIPEGGFAPELVTEAQAATYLEKVRALFVSSVPCGRLSADQVTTKVVYAPYGEEIGEQAEFFTADIVMVSLSSREWQRPALGGFTSKLLQRNCCPLIVLKEDSTLGRSSVLLKESYKIFQENGSEQTRVVLALDGTQGSEGAIPQAIEFTRKIDAELHLLTVIESENINSKRTVPGEKRTGITAELTEPELVEKALGYLESTADNLQLKNATAFPVVGKGCPATFIHNYALRCQASAVVMATRRGEAHGRYCLGSVADGVLRLGGVPLLMVPVCGTHSRQVTFGESTAAKPAITGSTEANRVCS